MKMPLALFSSWLVLLVSWPAAARSSFEIVEVTRDVDSGDGFVREFTLHYTYDRRGNPVRAVTERDLNADGTNDYRSVVTYTYGRRGSGSWPQAKQFPLSIRASMAEVKSPMPMTATADSSLR